LTDLNRRVILCVASASIAAVVLLFGLGLNWIGNQVIDREFYVGVEYAYGGEVCEVKALVDKVSTYTNLFIIGAVDDNFKANRSALDEACDYIVYANITVVNVFCSSDATSR
jgi:hypothetical protein